MHHRVLHRGACAALMIVGLSVVGFGSATVASAAPVTLGCDVTSGGVEIPLDVTVDTTDPALDGYANGSFLALHDAFGSFSAVPALAGELGEPPVCAVEVQRDDLGVVTFGEPVWLWCSDITTSACVGGPGADQGSAIPDLRVDDIGVLPDTATWLTVDQKSALIGWAVASASGGGSTEQIELQAWQNRIWCIANGTSDIETGDPGPYVPGDPATATCAGFRSWLQANVLPLLAMPGDSIQVQLSGTSAVAPIHQILRLAVTSTLPTVQMGATETLLGNICEDDTSGATFADSTITMTPGTTAQLCVTSENVGEFRVMGGNQLMTPDYTGNLVKFESTGCQVYVSGDTTLDVLQSQEVVLSWTAEQPAPTTTTTTPPTTAPRSLAFTG